MQMFKALINSLPYEFENVVYIGDFPKSTVQAMLGVKTNNSVLCNLSGNIECSGVTQKPFPVAQAFSNNQYYLRANLKGFSSLKAPADIKQRLPGIIFDETPLQPQLLERLIESLAIEEGTANLAVLNLNGAEFEYLVEDTALLNTFNSIVISCTSTNMFEGAEKNYQRLLSYFRAHNIAYSIFPAEVHPFSFVLVHRMPNWKENANMLTNVKQQLEACEGKLANALSSQQAEVEVLKEKVKTQTKDIEALEAKCEKLIQDLQRVEGERNKAQDEFNQQTQSARISNKLNLKLQVDLDDLRAKYAEKEQNERELSQLIEDLYVKLKQASEFYYELEKKYPELTDEQRD